MKVKIVAQFNDDNGDYRHADLTKGLFVDVRDHIGELWVKNGWAIAIYSEEKEPPKAIIEIETTEGKMEAEKRETAVHAGRKK